MWLIWEINKMHSEFWWGNLKEGEHLEGLLDGRID